MPPCNEGRKVVTQVRFLLTRLLKVCLVGFYVLIGTSLTLAGFGLIPEWGAFSGDGFLHELWVKPWSIAAATVWFGIAILFFHEDRKGEEEPVVEEPPAQEVPVQETHPLLEEHVYVRYMESIEQARKSLEGPPRTAKLAEATDALLGVLEDLADQLRMKEV